MKNNILKPITLLILFIASSIFFTGCSTNNEGKKDHQHQEHEQEAEEENHEGHNH